MKRTPPARDDDFGPGPNTTKTARGTGARCVICGSVLKDKRKQTCGAIWCQVTTALNPQVSDPARENPSREGPGWTTGRSNQEQLRVEAVSDQQRLGEQAGLQALDASLHLDEEQKVLEEAEDERGADRPAPMRENLWSPTCELRVALKGHGNKAHIPFVVVELEGDAGPREQLLRQHLGGSGVTAELYDVLLAWHCDCAASHTVIYDSVEDVPDEPGIHGACPACGQAALWFREEEDNGSKRGHCELRLTELQRAERAGNVER